MEYSGIARIFRRINEDGKKENDVEHSIDLIVPHKEKTRMRITTHDNKNIKTPEDDDIWYDKRHYVKSHYRGKLPK